MVDTRTALEAHRHNWQLYDEDHGYHCTECSETCPACIVTHLGETHPTGSSLLICEACIRAERYVIDDILHALAHYQPNPPTPIKAARYDKILVHGTPGDTTNHPTPADIHHTLQEWADTWAATGYARTVAPADYLKGHILWAAHNPHASHWDDYRAAIRKLRHKARGVAHLLPRREPGPCIHCGGTIVRDWAERDWTPREDGLSEIARCARCGTEWESWSRLAFAQRHTIKLLPQVRPDVLITLANALTIWPNLPKSTLWTWVDRDQRAHEESIRRCDKWEDAWTAWHDDGNYGPWPQPPEIVERTIPERGWDARGVPVYAVGDIAAMMERRAAEGRPGRRAAV